MYEGKKYKNTFNIFIQRHAKYNTNGRNQTEEEARAIDVKLLNWLDENDLPYTVADGTEEGYDQIVDAIIAKLGVEHDEG